VGTLTNNSVVQQTTVKFYTSICVECLEDFNFGPYESTVNLKVKVKFTLEQAKKAQRGSRGLFVLGKGM